MCPVLVIISDIHYNINTLALADAAMNQAIKKANDLDLPLVVAGDLLDQKSNLHAEYVNAIIVTIQKCAHKPFIIVGNHSRLNEKSPEHALNFLRPYATIIDIPTVIMPGVTGIPYYHDPVELTAYVKTLKPGTTLIMHQGVTGSNSGDYYVDKSAVPSSLFDGLRVISGHYHSRQDIPCGGGGLLSYVGNPYSLTFGESKDPEKGYRILNSDGSLDFVPTNLRRHIVFEISATEPDRLTAGHDDLVWVKVSGAREQIRKYKPTFPKNWKIEYIITDKVIETKELVTELHTLQQTIQGLDNVTLEQKQRLLELCGKYET